MSSRPREPSKPKRNRAAVTASTESAASAGRALLEAGGNAFDAAVATALATCVSDPGNTGIGGYGGNMVARRRDGTTVCVDFNTWAPQSVAIDAQRPVFPQIGPKGSSLPNNVAGLARILDEYGTKSWAEVSEPAIALARDGVVGRGTTIRAFIDSTGHDFLDECFELDWGEVDGQRSLEFRQPLLARTLETMAREGPDWFYRGPFAEAACSAMQAGGVSITTKEWASIPDGVHTGASQAVEIGGFEFYAPALPVTGAPCTLANVYAAERIAREAGLETAEALVRLARHMASVWQYRFATPHGNEVELSTFASWMERAIAHPPGAAVLKPAVGPGAIGHTAHLNTLDHDGTLVSLTLTHGFLWFGAAWAVPGTGVTMNSGMLSYNWAEPVHRDDRNFAVCNISPLIVEDRAGNALAIGCPGGRRIASRMGLALARHCFGGLPLQAAISSGRIHVEDATLAKVEHHRLGPSAVRTLRSAFPALGPESIPGYNSPLSGIGLASTGEVTIGLDDRDTPAWGYPVV